MIRYFKQILGWVHKFIVPILFMLNVCFSFSVYEDWYRDNYDTIEGLFSISVIPCLVFIYEGYIRRKCMWFKISSFGLLFSSSFNLLDNYLHFNEYVIMFRTITFLVITTAIFYFFMVEFKGVKE